MAIPRMIIKISPLLILSILVTCLIFQESVVLNDTEVRQEIIYKFNALEQKQVKTDFTSLSSNDAIDKQIVDQIIFTQKRKKEEAQKKPPIIDKTKIWFKREPVKPSNRDAVLHPFFNGFVIENPNLCGEEPVDVLIFVNSAVDHEARRRAIRETWGNTKIFHDINVKTVFILGKPAKTEEQMDILSEHASHGDIIQGNFDDTFRNLTMKAISFMIWTNLHCSQVKYILKADDDYFVDIFDVIENLLPTLANRKRTLLCRHSQNFTIIRSKESKWHVDKKVLPNRKYHPQFCSGFAVLFTSDLIPVMFEKSYNVTDYIPIDDVYLFGMLLEKQPNITFIDIRDKLALNTRPNPQTEISRTTRFEFSVFECPEPETMKSLWDLRMQRLSDWGRAHSLYYKLFDISSKKGAEVVV